MPPAAVRGLRGLLDGAELMIEYGSGGSTIMAAGLGVQVVSVETDHHFAAAVIAAAAERGLAGVRVLKADLGWTMEWGYPFDQYPTRRNLARWRRYVEAPWAVIGNSRPDLILIDGRFRKACLAGAVLECLRRGISPPIVIDDYTDRPHYAEVETLVEIHEPWDRAVMTRIRADTGADDARAALDRWLADPK